jgi:PKD repeat protein
LVWANSQFVAVGEGGTILTSPDGVNWRSRTSGTNESLNDVAYKSAYGLLVAVGDKGTVVASYDGVNWISWASGTTENLGGVVFAYGLLVAVGSNGTILTTLNGVNWTRQQLGTGVYLSAVAWTESYLVAVGWSDPTLSSAILTSGDGVTWVSRQPGIRNDWLADVVWTGSQLISVGKEGTIVTSSDGIRWVQRQWGLTGDLLGVTWTGSQVVAVGYNGQILTSPDGENWTPQSSPTSLPLCAVTWAGSQLVAVGAFGTILTSPCGGCTTPGTAPTLTATPASSSSISLSWNAVPNATAYKVYRDGGAAPIYSGSALSFTDTGLQPNTQHCYTVRGTNSCGDGPLSAQKCVTTSQAGTAPTANFTWSPGTPLAGQSVQFTDTSTGSPTSWSWTFGDGATSAQQNPAHTYSSAGTMNVTLTVSNQSGSNSRVQSVNIQASPGAQLTLGFTINGGQDFKSGQSVPVVISFSNVGAATWPAQTLQVWVYLVDVKGVGNDSIALGGWTTDKRALAWWQRQVNVPSLQPGQPWTETIPVSAYSADFIDEVDVVANSLSGSQVAHAEHSVHITFDAGSAIWNCIGDVLTVASLPVGGSAGAIPDTVKYIYDTTQYSTTVNAIAELWLSGDVKGAISKVIDFAKGVAVDLASVNPAVAIAKVVWNELGFISGGPGGCGTVVANWGSWFRGTISTLNYLALARLGVLQPMTVFALQGSGQMQVTDSSGRRTYARSGSSVCSASIPGSDCVDLTPLGGPVTIMVPYGGGPYSYSATTNAGGQANVVIWQVSSHAAASSVSALAATSYTTDEFSWTLNVNANDTLSCSVGTGQPQLGVDRGSTGTITTWLPPTVTVLYPSTYVEGRSLWVPVASHASGLNDSQWRTDLGLLNTGSVTANVQITVFMAGGIKLTNTTYVPAGSQSILTDIVDQLGGSGSGALQVISDQPLKVTERTYNQSSTGTFGQGYDALTVAQGLSAGQSAWLPQLSENAAYRTNIGLTNTGASPASVSVELHDGAGGVLKTYAVSLNPGEWKQETRPFNAKAGQTNMARGYARVTVTSGSGVIAYAALMDNTTNDPTTVPMLAETGQQSCSPPSITVPPANQTVASGRTATLSVVATGSAPLRYQWYQGNASDTSKPVGSDSASFTTDVLTATTSYWVRVSNACDHADSGSATVLVASGPCALGQSKNIPTNYVLKGADTWATPGGRLLALVGGIGGLALIDVSQAQTVQSISGPTSWQAVGDRAGRVYLASDTSGLQVYMVGEGTQGPVFVASAPTSGNTYGLAWLQPGQILAAAADTAGLEIYQVNSNGIPTRVATYATQAPSWAVALDGTLLASASTTFGLELWSYAGGTTLTPRGRLTLPGNAYDVELSGGFAYVSAFNGGLHIVDVRNPDAPVLTTTLHPNGASYRVFDAAVRGSYLAVAASTTSLAGLVTLYNISNPASPTQLGQVSPTYTTSVAFVGSWLVVGKESYGASIIDMPNCWP